ncbi:hypothetical protein M5K25_025388 [Dendrobium thyrsiflorum]|uniref:methenyltetrahydrofolate cyclohydrolase n=1 Tax=Dendrobium thyrsiflorum TaxID=117978 RepID=A0ABD0U3X8_DENTH
MKLNSEDSDLIIASTGLTSHNSELILDNSDYDLDNLELGVTQESFLLDLHPDLSGPESIDLRIITKSDPIENINILLEDINLTLNNSEPNLEDEHPKFLLESILGVAPLDLHLKECVSPDLTYLNNPCTDLNENISPYLPVASLTVVPAFVLKILPHLLSPIPAGDSLGYPIVVMSHDPSPYRDPDSYILPSLSSSFPIKDHLSPSWLTLLDYTTATGRLSMTLAETPYRNTLVAKDVFIATPTPIPLNMETLCDDHDHTLIVPFGGRSPGSEGPGRNRLPRVPFGDKIDSESARGYRLVGDVCFGEASCVASAITPVPGGVGPMTIAMLLSNTLSSFKRIHHLKSESITGTHFRLERLSQDSESARGYRLVGDVCFGEASSVASAITPVPGGVGPMTIAMLLSNTLSSFKRIHHLK